MKALSGKPARRGSFAHDGSWSSAFDSPTPTERLVELLVRARQASHLSPAQLAHQIRQAVKLDAFPCVLEWGSIISWRDWPLAPTSTAAEEVVKRCGRGPVGAWVGGEWVAGEQRPGPAALPAPEHLPALEALGWETEVPLE
jgi:hypothetical protein